jgi:hypothetical protein
MRSATLVRTPATAARDREPTDRTDGSTAIRLTRFALVVVDDRRADEPDRDRELLGNSVDPGPL